MSVSEDVTGALRAQEHGHQPIVYGMAVVQGADMYNGSLTGDIAATLNASSGESPTHSGPSVVCLVPMVVTINDIAHQISVYDARGNGDGKTVCTLTGDHQNRVTDYTALCIGNGQANQSVSDKAGALNTMHDQQAVLCFQNTGQGWWNESNVGATIRTPCGCDSLKANLVAAVDCRNGTENESINGTLQAKSTGGIGVNFQNVVRLGATVRRITPLECERLQGYPDGWTDIGNWTDSKGKVHKGESDSPRYKALGNSIALPFWEWMAKRMVDVLKADGVERPTMASLFDGIGGFHLAYSRAGCDPVWASEIEEFPIAVTRIRFPEEGKHEQKDRRPAPGANVNI